MTEKRCDNYITNHATTYEVAFKKKIFYKQLNATTGASKYMHPVYGNRKINFAQTSLKHYRMLPLQNQYNAGSEQ